MIPEQLAKLFHGYYEGLSEEYGYTTREKTAMLWEKLPASYKNLMVTVAKEIMKECYVAEKKGGDKICPLMSYRDEGGICHCVGPKCAHWASYSKSSPHNGTSRYSGCAHKMKFFI